MKDIFKKIRREWMSKVRTAQIKLGDNAPLEINDKPTLIHRDCAILQCLMSLEEVNERREAIQSIRLTDEERLIEVADALADEYYLWAQAVISHGLEDKIEELVLEVHRSNLTKLQDGEMITNDIGKIQKPLSYESPNLKSILF